MFRFAAGAFLAALLSACALEPARQQLLISGCPYDGIAAVVLIAAWIAALFVSIAFAFERRPWIGKGKINHDSTLTTTLKPIRVPARGAPMDPDAPNVRQLREICRQDAVSEIRHLFREADRARLLESAENAAHGVGVIGGPSVSGPAKRRPRARDTNQTVVVTGTGAASREPSGGWSAAFPSAEGA